MNERDLASDRVRLKEWNNSGEGRFPNFGVNEIKKLKINLKSFKILIKIVLKSSRVKLIKQWRLFCLEIQIQNILL